MNAPAKKQRIVWIDSLKVIAACMVVFYHSTLYTWNITVPGAPIRDDLIYYARTFLSACIPIFFFVHGFLLFGTEFNFKKHLQKLLKTLCTCLVWMFLTLLLLMLIRRQPLSPLEFCIGLFEIKDDWTNHLWFLGTLVAIYILYPALKITYDHNRKVFCWLTAVAAVMVLGNTLINDVGTVFLYLLGSSGPVLDKNYFTFYNPFVLWRWWTAVYFCAGGIVRGCLPRIQNIPNGKRYLTAGALLLAGSLSLFTVGIVNSRILGYNWDVVYRGTENLFGCMIAGAIFLLLCRQDTPSRLCSIISANSLGIYLLHPILIDLTKQAALRLPMSGSVLFTVFYGGCIFLFSLLITMGIRHFPFTRRLFLL